MKHWMKSLGFGVMLFLLGGTCSAQERPKPGTPPFAELPTEVPFYTVVGGGLYMPGRAVPTEIRLQGQVTFLLQPTGEPDVLSVSVKAMALSLVPTAVPLDVNNDGLLESIELGEAQVGAEIFDLESSTGTVDLRTGDFKITWVVRLDPNKVPMLRTLGAESWGFTVADRGYMDFEEGTFEIHAGVFEIPEGPLAGVLVRGSAKGKQMPTGKISLSVAIPTPGKPGCGPLAATYNTKQQKVRICEGDQVVLCWNSSKDVSVDLMAWYEDGSAAPGGQKGLSYTGVRKLRPPHPTVGRTITYEVRTIGGDVRGGDQVKVFFHRDGDDIRLYADPDPGQRRWEEYVAPESVSLSIWTDYFWLGRGQAPGGRYCLDWKKYFVEHMLPVVPGYLPTGKVGFVADGFIPIRHAFPSGRRRLPGFWWFYSLADPSHGGPQPDPYDVKDPVCISAKVVCRHVFQDPEDPH